MDAEVQEYQEIEPIESQSTELGSVLSEGDPEVMLALLEKKAQLAPRYNKAIQTILISQTEPEDWNTFGEGDKATSCLSSAGAERVARLFDIRYYEVKHKKEEFTDTNGRGYRYVFEGKAAMGSREVYSIGVYGTRDKFLGYKSGEWKAVEDINENHIRNAAYHIFCGNAVKNLLGLRGISKRRFDEIMGGAGGDVTKSTKVTHGNGTQGGTSQDDSVLQKQLAEDCIAIANAGCTVTKDGKNWRLEPLSESEDREILEIAKDICCRLSSFENKDKKVVDGKPASQLKGKRLEITASKAHGLAEQINSKEGDTNGSNGNSKLPWD